MAKVHITDVIAAFTHKDLRTFLRILHALRVNSRTVGDLVMYLEERRKLESKTPLLRTSVQNRRARLRRAQEIADSMESSAGADALLEALGYYELRHYLKLRSILEAAGRGRAEIKAYVRTLRKRVLAEEQYGRIRP